MIVNTIDLSNIDRSVNNSINLGMSAIKGKFLDKDVIIPMGKYQGRRGRVTSIHHNGRSYGMMIQPYRLTNQGQLTDELLWDHGDARTLWPVDKFYDLEVI